MSKRSIRCPKCHNEIEIYQNPIPTVDIIIEVKPKGIVLIGRKNPPYGWAIPGGFVDYGESLEDAALREAREETGLAITSLRQFHTYSDPRRDPRHHSISTVFVAKAAGIPVAKDDALEIGIFDRPGLPRDMAFDHRSILEDYFKSKEKVRARVRKPDEKSKKVRVRVKKPDKKKEVRVKGKNPD